jgi:hypothetical protein
MSPGARTMPAAMVFPTAAAMPNQIPNTFKSFPRPGCLGVAGRSATREVEVGSEMLDNGWSQDRCNLVIIRA